jgi:hypothetical protein
MLVNLSFHQKGVNLERYSDVSRDDDERWEGKQVQHKNAKERRRIREDEGTMIARSLSLLQISLKVK